MFDIDFKVYLAAAFERNIKTLIPGL